MKASFTGDAWLAWCLFLGAKTQDASLLWKRAGLATSLLHAFGNAVQGHKAGRYADNFVCVRSVEVKVPIFLNKCS